MPACKSKRELKTATIDVVYEMLHVVVFAIYVVTMKKHNKMNINA